MTVIKNNLGQQGKKLHGKQADHHSKYSNKGDLKRNIKTEEQIYDFLKSVAKGTFCAFIGLALICKGCEQ